MLWDALQTGFVWVLRFHYACNALEVACKFGQPGRAVGLCFWCMQFWSDCMLWDSLRVDTQGRKGGSDSTLEFCGFLVLLFGNHARVLGLGLVESIVISE